MPARDIFAGVSDLKFASPNDVDRFRGLLPKNYDSHYIRQRMETEKKLYGSFKAKGGMPKKKHPYYLTLGCCDPWFFGKKHFFGSLVFDLEEFEPETVSFTYGDSIPTFMDAFDDGKEYRKNVYTLEELPYLIEKYGCPQEWNPFAEKGPENYIEAQVWTDHPIITCRPWGYPENEGMAACVPLIASRMMRAKGLGGTGQRSYGECMEAARSSPWWGWFGCRIKQADPKAFQPNLIHGISHGYKCASMALVLASFEGLNEMDTKTFVLAALYHDIGRKYYDNGRSHGRIGADMVSQYIDPAECIHWEKLVNAIRFHDSPGTGLSTGWDILQRLRDVDTLDYLRLGFGGYRPEFLRTAQARELVRFSLELNMYTYLDADWILKLVGGE